VVSGTPTSGSDSEAGLYQLLRILHFLRHPKWGGCGGEDEEEVKEEANEETNAPDNIENGDNSSSSAAMEGVEGDLIQSCGENAIENDHGASNSSSAVYPAPFDYESNYDYCNGSSSSSSAILNGSSSSSSAIVNGSSNSTELDASIANKDTANTAETPTPRKRRSFPSSRAVDPLKLWRAQVVKPCLAQKPEAWKYLIQLLQRITVRHTKVAVLLTLC